ncbi:helix-turn-helix domain-containing protein [Candidatus Falkowbacteria bacterium]|nr:helix-turn-helix domain-containing protein [Candidatus Falkowbacteria bacterium]
MGRYDEKRISYAKQERLLNLFCDTICDLNNKIAIRNFLKDLLNRNERAMLARRLLIAEMLSDKRSYREISERLRCGSATISRVQRWLNFGRGGYQAAIRLRRDVNR